MSDAAYFPAICRALKVPEPVAEFKFHPTRKWRFDFAFPEARVAVECEGGVWVQGRHTRGKGYLNDLEKYNTATSMGWRMLRVTPDQLCTPETIGLIRETLAHGAQS